MNNSYTQFNWDDFDLVEEKGTSKKAWHRFLRVVFKKNGGNFSDKQSPRGYAVCRLCQTSCCLGPKGGTKNLEKHVCPVPVSATANDSALRLAEKKLIKNKTEKDRKDELSAIIKDMSSLVMGQEDADAPLKELTRARLTRACLAEVPKTLLQFYTDGKSAKDRPMSFYDEFLIQLNLLNERFYEARCEAYREPQQPVNYTVQNATPPNLHLGVSYSKTDETTIEITWVSTDINMIGRKLSEFVHPEDYAELVHILLSKRSADDSTTDRKDFSFPECRVTGPIRYRLKTPQEYKMVFLTGYIRKCARTPREKSSPSHMKMSTFPGDSAWPRLASFLHIQTHYQYMTLHSMDGKIIQADKRITMVAGYTCDEVINKSAHEFIREDALPIVSQAQHNWLLFKGANWISYPLKAKNVGKIVYVKSRGEIVYFRDNITNQLVQGFILNNALINEKEYDSERSNLQVQLDSSYDPFSSFEKSFEASSSSQMEVEKNNNKFFENVSEISNLKVQLDFSSSSENSFIALSSSANAEEQINNEFLCSTSISYSPDIPNHDFDSWF